MVNNDAYLSSLFGALSDPTRRNILQRLMDADLTVGEIAKQYAISIPAISKHLSMLERAKLIIKRKSGKERIISINPTTLESASKYLAQYERLWTQRLDRLDTILKEEQ